MRRSIFLFGLCFFLTVAISVASSAPHSSTNAAAPAPGGKHKKQPAASPTPTPTPVPLTAQVNPKDGLTYIWIPAGKFIIGCSQGDGECFDPEEPAHEVTLTQGFWMSQTLVTQAAFQSLMKTNPSKHEGAKLPVESVTWDEAKAYCTAASMRLPTEAEWEYAARAGCTAARCGELNDIAWWFYDSEDKTHEVAQKQPNAWKLYDTLGNVWEWTADWWDQEYYNLRVAENPAGAKFGGFRVMRGGAIMSPEKGIRLSNRSYRQPESRDQFIGFRCAGN